MERRFEYNNFKFMLNDNEGKRLNIGIMKDDKQIDKVMSIIFNFNIDFKLWTFENDEKKYEEKIVITPDNPLYTSFLKLLKENKKLDIDDDFCPENNLRYLRIEKINSGILLTFHDQKTKEGLEKYTVRIKNMLYDPNSKIDKQGLDTKDRLRKFSINIDEVFQVNQSYQKLKTF